jgi:hypothetical protein
MSALSPGFFGIRRGVYALDKIREDRERLARCWNTMFDWLLVYDHGNEAQRANVLDILGEAKWSIRNSHRNKRRPAPWLVRFVKEMRTRT